MKNAFQLNTSCPVSTYIKDDKGNITKKNKVRKPLQRITAEYSGKSEPKSDQNSCFKGIFETGSFSCRGSIGEVITYDNPFPLKRHT